MSLLLIPMRILNNFGSRFLRTMLILLDPLLPCKIYLLRDPLPDFLQAFLPLNQLFPPPHIAFGLLKHIIALDFHIFLHQLNFNLILREALRLFIFVQKDLEFFLVGHLQILLVFHVLENHIVSVDRDVKLLLTDMALKRLFLLQRELLQPVVAR